MAKGTAGSAGRAVRQVVVRAGHSVPVAAVGVRDELNTDRDTGDFGKPRYRRFCPNCGSGVIADITAMFLTTLVLAASLDDTSVFNPAMAVYCSVARPRTQASAARTRFARMAG